LNQDPLSILLFPAISDGKAGIHPQVKPEDMLFL
jgi:hypothetical protein